MILRRGLEGILPREVQWRSFKARLEPSFHHGLLTLDRSGLEAFVEDPGPIGEYLDVDQVRAIFREYQGGQYRTRTGNDNGFTLWRAAMIAAEEEKWIEDQLPDANDDDLVVAKLRDLPVALRPIPASRDREFLVCRHARQAARHGLLR